MDKGNIVCLQAPINDYKAAAGFIGLKPTTRKNHLVRALLESIVFGMLLLYETLCSETSFIYKRIRLVMNSLKKNFEEFLNHMQNHAFLAISYWENIYY